MARRVLYGHSRRSDEGGFTGGFPFGEFYQYYPYDGGSGLCGVDYERKNLTPIFTAWRICFAERSGEISENQKRASVGEKFVGPELHPD